MQHTSNLVTVLWLSYEALLLAHPTMPYNFQSLTHFEYIYRIPDSVPIFDLLPTQPIKLAKLYSAPHGGTFVGVIDRITINRRVKG